MWSLNLPSGGTERETALDRVRTEIMSGGGPDVFIIGCNGGRSGNVTALFQIPEKAMVTGIFLPLDEYIENAQFMEWDELTPAVMEAGCNEEGRMILPLAYTVPVTVYRKAEVSHVPSKTTTWQDMPEDESLVLTAAANWLPTPEEAARNQNECGGVYVEYALGELADYSEEKLLFTEEELLQRLTEISELNERQKNGEFDALPNYCHWLSGVGFTDNTQYPTRCNGISEDEALTMIPIYSDDGGYTASVTSYAAVSWGTKRLEDAFFLLDVLLRKETQQKSDLYRHWITGSCPGL